MAEFVIATIIVSCFSAAVACVIVYLILYNKHDEDIAKLSKELEDTKAELKNLSRFRCLYNRYRKYKECESNYEYFIKAFEECDYLE
jgi:hypothetical protein